MGLSISFQQISRVAIFVTNTSTFIKFADGWYLSAHWFQSMHQHSKVLEHLRPCFGKGDLRNHHALDLFGLTAGDLQINRFRQDLHVIHMIHDSDPGLCSQSFWFKIASWLWKFASLSPLCTTPSQCALFGRCFSSLLLLPCVQSALPD